MNLIIVSNLTDNEGLYFRFLTMVAKKDFCHDILIEAEREKIDYYYLLLKKNGWFDFVDDFIEPKHREEGIRIDTEYNFSRTIKVNSINCQTVPSVLGQIKCLGEITL